MLSVTPTKQNYKYQLILNNNNKYLYTILKGFSFPKKIEAFYLKIKFNIHFIEKELFSANLLYKFPINKFIIMLAQFSQNTAFKFDRADKTSNYQQEDIFLLNA